MTTLVTIMPVTAMRVTVMWAIMDMATTVTVMRGRPTSAD
jgi:hypothetical protein